MKALNFFSQSPISCSEAPLGLRNEKRGSASLQRIAPIICLLACFSAMFFYGCDRQEKPSSSLSVDVANGPTGATVPSDGDDLPRRSPKQKAAEHFKRGYEYYRKGNEGLAIKEYKSAIETEPNSPEYYAHLGSVYDSMKKLEEAKAMYGRAVELGPGDPQYSYNLAMICMSRREYKAAEKHLEAVVRMDRDFRNVHFLLGKLYATDRSKYDGAIKELRKAIAKDPRNAVSHYSLGQVYEWKAQLDKAEDEYRRAVELDDDNFIYRYRFGKILLRRGDKEEGRKELEVYRELQGKYMKDVTTKETEKQRHAYGLDAYGPENIDN